MRAESKKSGGLDSGGSATEQTIRNAKTHRQTRLPEENGRSRCRKPRNAWSRLRKCVGLLSYDLLKKGNWTSFQIKQENIMMSCFRSPPKSFRDLRKAAPRSLITRSGRIPASILKREGRRDRTAKRPDNQRSYNPADFPFGAAPQSPTRKKRKEPATIGRQP